ncbi:MAG: hypothetical protein ACYTDX_04110 [Planctomycetota bacterium]
MIGFVHIRKTGGSTVKFILRNSFVLRHCNLRLTPRKRQARPADLALAKRVHPGLRSISGHSLIHPTEHFPDVRFFTFLRDPVSRIASAYSQHVRGRGRQRRGQRELSLEEFVERSSPRGHAGFQTYQISGGSDPEAAKAILREHYFFVGLTERFDESLSALEILSPYPLDTRYRLLNAAPGGDEVKMAIKADPEKRAVIEAGNRSDRILYDWVVEELYPEYLERAREKVGAELPAHRNGDVGNLRYRMSSMWDRAFFRSFSRMGNGATTGA